MKHPTRRSKLNLAAALILFSCISPMATAAETPQSLLAGYEQAAGAGFVADVSRGKTFYHTQQGDWSCATCHTANPLQMGKHTISGKVLQPLSPNADPKRFTDSGKAEKWFGRNCREVVKRECTAGEKADFIAYLLSVK